MIDQETQRCLQNKLRSRRAEILRRISDIDATIRTEQGYEKEWELEEFAEDEVEFDRILPLSSAARKEYEEIVDALLRIGKGDYGYCVECGREIAIGRLELIPEAKLCVDCKSREEMATRPPPRL